VARSGEFIQLMVVVFFVRVIRERRFRYLGRGGTGAALPPGVIPLRIVLSGITGWSDRFRPRDGKVCHALLRVRN